MKVMSLRTVSGYTRRAFGVERNHDYSCQCNWAKRGFGPRMAICKSRVQKSLSAHRHFNLSLSEDE